MEGQKVIRLPSVMCLIIDFPLNSNRTICSPSNSSGNTNSSTSGACYTCPLVSSYLNRDIDQGRQTCYVLWALILIIGSFGVVTNCLNIVIILGKSPFCGPSLTSLLIPLSIFDMITSGFAVSYTTLSLIILENMSRSWLTMKLYHFSLVAYLLGRTGSLYMAVLITVERYLVVTYPLKMKIYLSVHKTKVVASITCIVAVLSSIPRYFSVSLEPNQHSVKDDKTITQLEDFPYLFHSTWLGMIFFRRMVWMGRLHFLLDFLLPLPILLVLNVMLFVKIHQVNLKRRLLSSYQKIEVRSAKMFVVLISVLLASHILPIIFYVNLTFYKIFYREFTFGTTLSVTVNATVNFIIYCAYGQLFRQRFFEYVSIALCKFTRRRAMQEN